MMSVNDNKAHTIYFALYSNHILTEHNCICSKIAVLLTSFCRNVNVLFPCTHNTHVYPLLQNTYLLLYFESSTSTVPIFE